jgi:hypothetical protein
MAASTIIAVASAFEVVGRARQIANCAAMPDDERHERQHRRVSVVAERQDALALHHPVEPDRLERRIDLAERPQQAGRLDHTEHNHSQRRTQPGDAEPAGRTQAIGHALHSPQPRRTAAGDAISRCAPATLHRAYASGLRAPLSTAFCRGSPPRLEAAVSPKRKNLFNLST